MVSLPVCITLAQAVFLHPSWDHTFPLSIMGYSTCDSCPFSAATKDIPPPGLQPLFFTFKNLFSWRRSWRFWQPANSKLVPLSFCTVLWKAAPGLQQWLVFLQQLQGHSAPSWVNCKLLKAANALEPGSVSTSTQQEEHCLDIFSCRPHLCFSRAWSFFPPLT